MSNVFSVFNRFVPFIREYIYREKWKTLHTFQEAAAVEIFDKKNHILIAAGTASGKTEAVFFPVLSILESLFHAKKKALVLYISPLKALINDQAMRLKQILRAGRDSGEETIPVWRWHGDVESAVKNRFLDDPAGILLITPESLEALLLRRPRELKRVFASLVFVVIDEVHVFMGSDRGAQLICQLERIARAVYAGTAANNPDNEPKNIPKVQYARRIGLSATLGDYNGARHWLLQGTNLDTVLVEEAITISKELFLALDYHTIQSLHTKGESFYYSLYSQCCNKRAIIFTNSRLEAEECSASLSALAVRQGEPDIFWVHHGSISALLRDEAEENLKSGEGPRVICATATLELGIDIGDLERIIQLGPPSAVSSFVQRLGRSGRRSGRAEMYFSIAGRPSPNGSSAIPWELLRTIAVIQLYLEEKWIEPPAEKPLSYSLLVHQTLAVLASLGEHSMESLSAFLLSLPPFRNVTTDDFRTLAAWLESSGCIGITEEGNLILGLEGERLVNHYSFYPVFPGDITFRVILDGREIGTVNYVPDPMSVLAVGGQRWVVKNIDGIKREIWVAETKDEGNERLWRGRYGDTHTEIIEKMRQILAETQEGSSIKTAYPYLSAAACTALEEGRRAARSLGIGGNALIPNEDKSDFNNNRKTMDEKNAPGTLFLFPWTGSAGIRTIAAVLGNDENKKSLRIVFVEEKEELYFRIKTKLPLDKFRTLLMEVCQKAIHSFEYNPGNEEILCLIRQKELPFTGKYDYLLPPKLLAKQHVANMLDKTALEKLVKDLRLFQNFSF